MSVEYPVHSKMMSNLEPHHLYHLQIAAMNSQGLIGPFSTILQVLARYHNDSNDL